MDINQKLLYRSNYWYNDGLKRANIRDMTGAIQSLRKSLKYNRENINARNLLGLVYFGCGEIVEALVQWIISKNLKSSDNIANYYIKLVQETPAELEAINSATKKYNQSLTYCRQGGEDLALIQLQKVVVAHPTFLKAQQLLGLLYLRVGKYQKATQTLRKAHRLDVTNPKTLQFMHELRQMRHVKSATIKEDKEDTVTYNLGNETIIQPAATGMKENANKITMLNIFIGILLGAAVIGFLIVPAVNQSRATRVNQDILKYTDEIAAQKAEMSALKQELDTLRLTKSEASEMKVVGESTRSSYEIILTVREQWSAQAYSNQSMAELLITVNQEALGEHGKALYDELAGYVYPPVVERQYVEGLAANEAGNYQEVIDILTFVMEVDPWRGNGEGLLVLANAHVATGNLEEAKPYFEQIIALFPDAEIATTAQESLDGME